MSEEKSQIAFYHSERDKDQGHERRLGRFSWAAALVLIVVFAIFFIPLFLYMLVFNQVYFWIRKEKPFDMRPYFNFDRHRIAHLSWQDRLWCEYCEWVNGALQWVSAIVHEIERRYCPIQNKCDPHCPKVKVWRKNYLDYDHGLDELKGFFKDGVYQDISGVEKDE